MKFFILIRYSYLTMKKGKYWEIQSNYSYEDYKRHLFSHERLAMRERLFRNITLPSIAGARAALKDPDALKVLIQTSDELPAEYMDRLQALLAPHPWISLVPMATTANASAIWSAMIKEELKKSGTPTTYATVRLDDDDGLARDFLTALDQYIKPELAGYVVSFAKGIRGHYDPKQESIMKVVDVNHPRIALGLSLINCYDQATDSFKDDRVTIFDCGSHVLIDQVMPMILDSRTTAYFHTVHPANDTAIAGRSKSLRERMKDLLKSCLRRRHEPSGLVSLYDDPQRRNEIRTIFSIQDEILPRT